MDQESTGNRQLFRRDGLIGWVADVPGSRDKYLALFNTRDSHEGKGGAMIATAWEQLGLTSPVKTRDLWRKQDLGVSTGDLSVEVPVHGAVLYRVSPAPAK